MRITNFLRVVTIAVLAITLLLATACSTTSNNDPTWSPDGTKIAFVSEKGYSTTNIWVMNADGSNQTRLTK